MAWEKQNPYFEVEEREVITTDGDLIVPRKAIVNLETNKVISVVSEHHKLIKNADIISKFKNYLKESDTKFTKMSDYLSGKRGQNFTAKYKFPEIEANFGEITTQLGNKMQDNVQLMLEVHNSYGTELFGRSRWGFDLGGYRLVCLNGLRAFDKMFQFQAFHTEKAEEEYENQIVTSFAAAKDIFENKLVKSWIEIKKINFDQARASVIVKALELSKLYQKTLDEIYAERIGNKNLKTMWDFYNMITWFTTHIVEQRNYKLARQVSTAALEQIREAA